MLKNEPKQLSLYSILYNKIPKNHILKQISNAVNFSFINEMLEYSYCKYYGRPAKEPEMMSKLLILQYLYNLSDENVIMEANLNIAYMWFLGINPEEDLPDPSLLAKFRTKRLSTHSVDEIIKEVVRQCISNGIIKDKAIAIDCTHVTANTVKKVPERIMKHLAKKILKEVEKENKILADELNKDIPNYKEIDDHKEAKRVMKEYLQELIEKTGPHFLGKDVSTAEMAIHEAKEVLSSPNFIEQRGIRSLTDKDARVGYKTKTDSFFGYKAEFTMIPGEKIITSIEAEDGAYVDGTNFLRHFKNSREVGLEIKEVYGDKAFFRKPLLDELEDKEIIPYIPVSASVYKLDESKFTYNKDSDQWICMQGNYTIRKRKITRKNLEKRYGGHFYDFDKKDCMNCPRRIECYEGKKKYKTLEITVATEQFYRYSQIQQTEEFKEKYKNRACQENKNGEMKRFHGMARAKGFGLKSMRMQVRLTALAVNLKRIAKLFSLFSNILSPFWGKRLTTIT